jgi:glycosyltransferase involved in cell wall biosynthesis
MKALFVVAGMGMGGAERVVSLLSAAWAERGWEVIVAAFDSPQDPVAHEFSETVELVRLGLEPGGGSRLRGLTATARRLLALRRLLRSRRPDIVISFLTKINVLTLLAAAGSGIPVVISERNNPAEQRAHPLWAWSWKLLAPRAAAIVLQTEAIRRRYPRAIAQRAQVIPNPVAIPRNIKRQHDGLVLAAVGRLTEQKGFDLLIHAFATLAGECPEWRLVIFGEGPQRPELERMVTHYDLTGRILLPGISANHGDWIGQADAFVLPSRFEGFPNVLVEAMLAGLPVVAFDCDFGPAEIVAHDVNGLLVPPGDVQELIVNLRNILKVSTLRDRLGDAARTSAAQFATERIVLKWDSLANYFLYGSK